MTVEQNKALVNRLFEEVLNQGKLESLDEIVTEDLFLEAPGIPTETGKTEGRSALKQWVSSYRTGFPDINYKIDDTVAEGNQVAIGFSFSGTHQGEFAGIAATGKKVTATELCYAHIGDGKISGLRLAPYGTPLKVQIAG